MIDVQQLLRMKENELALVRKEIEALRTVAPLLSGPPDGPEGLQPNDDSEAVEEGSVATRKHVSAGELSPDSEDEIVLGSIGPKRSRLRDWLGRAVGE